MSEYPAIDELSELDGTNGFEIAGAQPGAQFGISVAAAGDVNGDGIDDFIIGAQSQDVGNVDTGASYIVFGVAGGFGATFDLTTLDGANGFRVDGVSLQDFSGRCVSSAGDVNGDGFDDIIIGAPDANPHGDNSGSSYVVFGKASGFDATLSLSGLDGTNGFKLNGEAFFDLSGLAVSGAGDVNGDGYDDILIGAFRASPNGFASGAAYVVFGKADGFSSTIELSDLDGTNGFKLEGEAAGDRAGRSVSGIGDVNGDGFDDLAVGAYSAYGDAPYSGVSYIVFGGPEFGATIQLADLDGSDGFQIPGVGGADYSGRAVSAAGDVNADGIADIIIGAPGHNSHAPRSGASYVVFGTTDGFPATLNLAGLDGTNGFQIRGTELGDQCGTQVSGAGDVNGDGFADLIVSAQYADPNGNYSGASYVIFGNASGFGGVLDVSDLDGTNGYKLNGEAAEDRSGFWVSGAGDVNDDGFDDVLVGAFLSDANGTDSGASYVVFGGKPTEAVARVGTAIANTIHGGDLNDTLSGLGGDDTLIGHDGNDSLDGGDGIDTASYGDAAAGVLVDLALTTAQDTVGAGIDSLVAIENLSGSAFADTLKGDGANNVLWGGAGDDALFGGGGNDVIDAGVGRDTISGGGGHDIISFGANFDTTDVVDGGGAADVIQLNGSYPGSISLTGNITNVETIQLQGGGNAYSVVALDSLLVGSASISLAASGAASLLFDGSAEITGSFNVTATNGVDILHGGGGNDTIAAGDGADTLSGGAGDDVLSGDSDNDLFLFANDSGNDSAYGGSGDDTFDFGASLTPDDVVDGGSGSDTLLLAGDYSTGVNFLATTMIGIETIAVAAGSSYSLAFVDANAGTSLVVDASALGASDTLHLDATDETSASITVTGGKGDDLILGGDGKNVMAGGGSNDILSGGAASDVLQGLGGEDLLTGNAGRDTIEGNADNDTIVGGLGADKLSGGNGTDTFSYDSGAESTQSGHDKITDVNFDTDRFDLWFAVTGIDTETTVSKFGKLHTQLDESKLGANHAVIVDIGSHKYLAIDANGIAGWQDDADVIVQIDHATNTSGLDTGDFI